MVGTGIQPMVSDVTIRARKSGIERLYHAGHASSGVAEFARDLDNGLLQIEQNCPSVRAETRRYRRAFDARLK